MSDMLRIHYEPSGMFARFAKLWYVSIHFFFKLSCINVTKIRPVSAAIFHTSRPGYGRKDGDT